MASKKRGLGKGLGELLSVALEPEHHPVTPQQLPEGSAHALSETATLKNIPSSNEVRYLPIEWVLKSRFQPRHEIDPEALEELSHSIKTHGVIQPIVVRNTDAPNRYELVAGERRWRASQLAGLEKVPAIVKPIDDEAALAIGLIENVQREDLNPLEEALAIKRLVDEFGLTHLAVSEAIGKSRATVTNLLRLLTLNEDVKVLLARGDLEMGHARALLALSDRAQSELARTVVMRGLSVRDTEQFITRLKNKPKVQHEKNKLDPNIIRLEEDLSERLSAKVSIKARAGTKGYVIINYNTLDELDGILAHIK